jgi:hypothetical protein
MQVHKWVTTTEKGRQLNFEVEVTTLEYNIECLLPFLFTSRDSPRLEMGL